MLQMYVSDMFHMLQAFFYLDVAYVSTYVARVYSKCFNLML
jgi:hypothetical protein